MRWLRLTRRRKDESAPPESSSGYTPGSWGQSSLPPADPDPARVPTGNVEVIQAAPPTAMDVSGVVGPPVPRAAGPVPPAPTESGVASLGDARDVAASGVRLGFEDGSDLALDPDHPHSLALKAVADLLLHRGPSRRRAG